MATTVLIARHLLEALKQENSESFRNWPFKRVYLYDPSQNGGAASGRLVGIVDTLNRTNTFTYDPNLSGRVTRQTFPNGRYIEFGYDSNGNLTGVTPPQKPVHLFDFNILDLLDVYLPPAATNTGNRFTTYDYNLNRQLTKITRPDGLEINFAYDAQIGRLDHIDLPFDEQISYDYVNVGCGCSGSGRPENVTFEAVDFTNTISYAYDGALVTNVAWSGSVAGSVGATYDSFFRVNGLWVNGANGIGFGYDDDGLLTTAGSLSLSRDPDNGRLTGTTLGNVSDAWTYNGFGEAETYTATADGNVALFAAFARDNSGRITNKTEVIGGVTSSYHYLYDVDRGWLTDVLSNGVATAHYEYDDNGNRTYALNLDREVSSGYDDQDRLLQSTNNGQLVTYAYSANGELIEKAVGILTNLYSYDVQGNLRGVVLSNGTAIDYVVDATGRRIGRKVNGSLVQGWLYQDGLKPIAELNSGGSVVSRFVYAGKANVPEYMVTGGVTYRLITDHLGSVRLVVNASSGAIAQRIDYDEFGRVLADTNPGFQPFGFAGGLYDPDTKLVRFGARDYDADSGRWTSKDPIGFGGGDANLFAYVANRPINLTDLFGLAYGNPVSGPSGPVGPSSPYAPGLPYYPNGYLHMPMTPCPVSPDKIDSTAQRIADFIQDHFFLGAQGAAGGPVNFAGEFGLGFHEASYFAGVGLGAGAEVTAGLGFQLQSGEPKGFGITIQAGGGHILGGAGAFTITEGGISIQVIGGFSEGAEAGVNFGVFGTEKY